MNYKNHLLFFVILILIAQGNAQQISGRLKDGSFPLFEASVVLLRTQDSIQIANTRANTEGYFIFKSIPEGDYTLFCTYPGYPDHVEILALNAIQPSIDFGEINFQQNITFLKEAIVTARKRPMQVKGDTIVFDASGFKVPANASVEELIKQFPGMQVDFDGNITSNGKQVTKVLVDGEEFFGDDPLLVTRNLKADMVEEAELYDKVSEEAAFSGINDGKKTKTLNLKLKENKKNGYFGKVQVGGGSQNFYENQVMYNSFKGKRKMAGYFTLGNTGIIGLDKKSQKSYAGGDSNPIENNLDNWNGTYEGEGIPKAISGGLHYDNKWDKDQQFVNLNYKIGSLNVIGEQQSLAQTNLTNSIQYTTSNLQFNNHVLRNGLNGEYEIKIDSTSNIKTAINGSLLNKHTQEVVNSETNKDQETILNTSQRNTEVEATTRALTADVLWQKKLNKERRTFSIGLYTILNNSQSTGNFYTQNKFFEKEEPINNTLIDQYKTTNSDSNKNTLNLTYSEPITKASALVLGYKLSNTTANSKLLSFNKNENNTYSVLDSLYSNRYTYKQLFNRGGFNYVHKDDKIHFQLGTDIAYTSLDQQNLFDQTALKRSFTNWFPNFLFTYNITRLSSININYTGNSIQPDLQQLQPITNNNDPLNIIVGNPNLDPYFENKYDISYSSMNKDYAGFFNVTAFLSTQHKAIISNTITDETTGASLYTYENLSNDQNKRYGINVDYNKNSMIWDLNVALVFNITGNNFVNAINNTLNTTTFNTYTTSLILSKQNDWHDLGFSISPSYNVNKNSLQAEIDNNYWELETHPFLKLYIGDFIFRTELNYTYKQKTQAFTTNFDQIIWNAWIGKKFLKNKNLLFKLNMHDILNENSGFERTVNNNTTYQNRYTSIASYFMASLIWDFNKTIDTK